MANPGFLEWAMSIRLIMANAPGRQFFHDQVQSHGFLFLEDYLANILTGPKRDPLIELVKTPGRKKGRKTKRTASTKSKSNKAVEKEDIAPKNNFYQTLLQAKMDLLAEADGYRAVEFGESPDGNGEFLKKLGKLQDIAVPHIRETLIDDDRDPTSTVPSGPQAISASDAASLGLSIIEQTELSVIAEDDESAECSHPSIRLSRHGNTSALRAAAASPPRIAESLANGIDVAPDKVPSRNSKHNSAKHGSISSTDSFHSANLSLPASTQAQPQVLPAVHSPPPTAVNQPVNTVIPPTLTRVENVTEPLPEIPPWHPPPTRLDEAVTEPLPSLPSTEEYSVPLRDATLHSPKGLAHKRSTTFLPTLPAPIPPRKSMRAKEPSIAGFTNIATPGNALGGKRSSWLIKAREAKAMEGTAKKISSLGAAVLGATTAAPIIAPVPGVSGALKRKSEELSGDSITAGIDEDRGRYKTAKLSHGDTASSILNAHDGLREKDRKQASAKHARPRSPLSSQRPVPLAPQSQNLDLGPADQLIPVHDEQDGILNLLKKTVEGLGARVGKSLGKSLGANSATIMLAEARAAAEARVVKREIASGSVETAQPSPVAEEGPSDRPNAYVADHSRLSVSDLAPRREVEPRNVKINEVRVRLPTPPVFLPQPPATTIPKASTSTTPPDSPQSRPTTSTRPAHPIFRTSPVFVPPPKHAIPLTRREITSKPLPTFSLVPHLGPPPITAAPIPPQSRQPTALSAQTTLESVASDSIFDAQGDAAAWMPATQDTEYSSAIDSQPRVVEDLYKNNLEDDDDSWPLDEKGPIWTFPVADGDDSWSDMDSVAPEVGPGTIQQSVAEATLLPSSQDMASTFESQPEQGYEEEYLGLDESELDGMMAEEGLSTVNLVPKVMSRSESQLSMTSSSSSNLGFLGQASKLVGSVLGTSKKAKTEVKSLQRAAVAAKKQQEEMGKKAARLKEMENRRQRALQRKADEELTRVKELEKKLKEESERRKREREEHTDKRQPRAGTEKDDDTSKRRKVVVEIDKKSVKKAPPNATKAAVPAKSTTFSKQLVAALNISSANSVPQATTAPASSSKAADAKTTKTSTAKTIVKGKTKAGGKTQEDDVDPVQLVQSQMAARVKIQMQAAKHGNEHEVPSESIELPDINSEYSDSGDERPAGSFNPPGWAQSPELRQALQMQSTMNPDEIFGAVRPLRMEEIFRARTSKFRARTSSANWSGPDGLTAEEERDYARRMGFR